MKRVSLFLMMICASVSFSQERLEYKTNLELGLGGNSFRGDVCLNCTAISPSVSLSSRFYLAGKFFFRPEINYNRFQSFGQVEDHLKFRNNSLGLNINLEYGLHSIKPSSFTKREKTEVFVSGILGALHHNPFTEIEGDKVFLQVHEIQGITYSKVVPVVGGGLNFNFQVPKSGRIGARIDFVYTFSDYLDNVSTEPFTNQVVLGEAKRYQFLESDFSINKTNDFYFRLQLTYELRFKTKHLEKNTF